VDPTTPRSVASRPSSVSGAPSHSFTNNLYAALRLRGRTHLGAAATGLYPTATMASGVGKRKRQSSNSTRTKSPAASDEEVRARAGLPPAGAGTATAPSSPCVMTLRSDGYASSSVTVVCIKPINNSSSSTRLAAAALGGAGLPLAVPAVKAPLMDEISTGGGGGGVRPLELPPPPTDRMTLAPLDRPCSCACTAASAGAWDTTRRARYRTTGWKCSADGNKVGSGSTTLSSALPSHDPLGRVALARTAAARADLVSLRAAVCPVTSRSRVFSRAK